VFTAMAVAALKRAREMLAAVVMALRRCMA
jgi:hypothetical protein